MLELDIYLVCASLLPLVLLISYFITAIVPILSHRKWSHILPSWVAILLTDVISDEDIRGLEEEEHKEEDKRKSQLTPLQRQREDQASQQHAAQNGPATEATPLLVKPGQDQGVRSSRPGHLATRASLAIIAMLQFCGWVAALTYGLQGSQNLRQLSFTAVVVVQLLATVYAVTVPYDLFVLYSVQALGSVLGLHLTWASGGRRLSAIFTQLSGLTQLASFALTMIALTIIVSMPLADPHKDQSVDALGRPSAAEDECTLWEWMTFSWMTPLISVAVQRTLEKGDVWQLSKGCRSSLLLRKFKEFKASSLAWQIIKANKHDVVLDAVLTLVSSFLSYASPFFLKRILDAIETSSSPHPPPNSTPKSTAYLFALLALIAGVLKSQADLQHLFYGRRGSIRIRGQLIASVYEKALRTRDMTGVLGEQKDKSPEDGSKTPSNGKAPTSAPEQKSKDSEATNDASVGRIVSLAAVDAIRIGQQCAGAYMLYSAPIEFVIASLFLYKLLGLSAFAGYLVLIVASPLQSSLTRRMIRISKSLSAARDKRLSSLNELISNLKFVKYYAFEEEMRRRVLDLREVELAWLKKRQINSAIIMALWTLTPAGVTTVSFACYVLIAKKDLDVPTAFTSIALFGLLKAPLNTLPVQINELLNAKVSSDRIAEFLDADEVPENVLCLDGGEGLSTGSTPPFGCENATFGWPEAPVSLLSAAPGAQPSIKARGAASLKKVMSRMFKRPVDEGGEGPTASSPLLGHDQDHSVDGTDTPESVAHAAAPFQLSDITFLPPSGRLSLVIGQTGSGKSALLTALLGEMKLLEGTSHLHKSNQINPSTGFSSTIAYCAQSPWLQHASIRSNILFGSPFELSRYNAVLDCCALRPDLEILGGDSTEIGEKGVSLSGGQQARVALARAVYSRAATVLLDDPLSAVDAHTASHLVRACLSGSLMKGRTVVLVTHHSELVLGEKAAQWVVKLAEGRIVAQGTPEELQSSGNLERDIHQETPDEDDKVETIENTAEQQAAEELRGEESTARKLVQEEHRAKGGVKREVYKLYLDGVGWGIAALVILSLIAYKGTDLAEKGWLAVWGASSSMRDKAGADFTSSFFNGSISPPFSHDYVWAANAFTSPMLLVHPEVAVTANLNDGGVMSSSLLPPAHESPLPYIFIFFGIQLLAAGTIIASALLTYYGSLRASRALFARMLTSTMGATARWLDTTPTGRIVNKFSRDIEVLDSNISNSLRYFISFVIAGIISVVTVVVVLPSFIIPTAILGAANYYVARGYIRAARDLRRLESVSRSPIFSAFSELLQGISTVRAFGSEKRMLRECTERIDLANSFFLYFWMTNRWLLFRLDLLGALAVFLATCAALRGSIAAGIAGLALTQAQGVIQAMYWLSRFYTNLEQDANSIERIREALDDVPQEPPAIIEGNRPPADWPNKGRVEVKDLVLRYAPDLPPVLHGIDFTIQPGEKVGIVGRTGSGKSTTALAFFRFVDFDKGSIHIDGVDISSIGLYDLRSKITIIPQNSVLFSGTIRNNLDPFDEHTDEECVAALEAVNIRTTPVPSAQPSRSASRATSIKGGVQGSSRKLLRPFSAINADASVENSDNDEEQERPSALNESQTYVTLDTRVSEQGGNFSQGQRQLLAMARALLRRSQVILMDEASSAVDFATDNLIQSTIRNGFASATVITIAHRLHTVAYADKVLVLSDGRVEEFDSPKRLLEDTKGAFYSMCEKSGDFAGLKAAVDEAERGREQKK
ncbi:hypothetical protein BCV69DRAFT_291227 [Microstroma glucosiphilum]|uniref:P-loop containing nucleoside triphosphate hydrolase protein n=1 Tax=Pseudomicrostroma glucosiphilum TaxID=1684307 RepID=A0A316U6X1_9BASI|nr:hypothetical protein BCV69DRAFT_291227 [Pseudomicrostroma glucosiphilum]PWN18685.1 hypothetical protein BCV69DRAFT_291227 [Pseudomicrostroma glucosiphilum]